MTYGAQMEALMETTEAVEDVDGKPEKSEMSSHSSEEKIVLQQVPTAREKRGQKISAI